MNNINAIRVKICGLFRDEDIEYANEAMPDYAGFVFAASKRQVSPSIAAGLRCRLCDEIIPVGVFVNASITDIVSLYNDKIIAIAQLHGTEDEAYISRLKTASAAGGREPVPVIKAVKIPASGFCSGHEDKNAATEADYYLADSGAGSGVPFNWDALARRPFSKPWFLAGGVNMRNLKQAMALAPYAIDISSGVETNGVKDREKMLGITSMIRKAENE
ncbi:MAG: phosphoribosylanthranilate isomerase [Treponema sp.]|jgi:phosphoribosylanthranilate isomerase|nr:phosphoribosylanthranilate isomerase [Treponema sp.]